MLNRIAFADTFFNATNKLPANIQSKVTKLVLQFQGNINNNGLNFEKLQGLKDKNMRSIRVDQTYRVILSKPDQGNIYLFLWVDHHDEAYQWASNHQCKINPSTGTIQLYTTVFEEAEVSNTSLEKNTSFSQLKDRELLKMGVPAEHLQAVRTVTSEKDLDRLITILPQEAYEALFFYMAGDTYEEILREREQVNEAEIDVNDFSSALERTESRAHFMVPASEDELYQMLNAPLDKWRVFLHSSQRKLVEGNKNGSVRVLGGAGTGKTVVALHRAKWLAENLATKEKKVLFTTFTKNLALDIQKNLKTICNTETLEKIEIINLDKWVQRFLRQQSYDFSIVYNQKQLDEYWETAYSSKNADIDFALSFFKEEWEKVIQAQGITRLEEYKKASRIGRGTRLNREQRVKIWSVFEEYRYQLNRSREKEVSDAYRDAASFIHIQRTEKQNFQLPYCSVIVDEAQDMGTQAFQLIREIVPRNKNDLFIAGDAHQRIYGRNRVVLGKCGIDIRGRSKKLKINYRTTDQIRRWASDLLKGHYIDDLDGGQDNNSRYKSLTSGLEPTVKTFDTIEQQVKFIKEILENSVGPISHFCIVTRTKSELQKLNDKLDILGIKSTIIKPNEPEYIKEDRVNLATVHRVKGLEFDHIILASANEGLIPVSAINEKADKVSKEEAETEERCLVYVAMTRARKSAYVLSYGQLSYFFK